MWLCEETREHTMAPNGSITSLAVWRAKLIFRAPKRDSVYAFLIIPFLHHFFDCMRFKKPKFTWNENRKNASELLIKLKRNTSLRALKSKWTELGRTAINVLTRHTIAICSLVTCNLKLLKRDRILITHSKLRGKFRNFQLIKK